MKKVIAVLFLVSFVFAGSASMRVTKQFESGRKMAKTHQNVLVFCKGDWKKAAGKNPA